MEELENHVYNAGEVERILEETPPGMYLAIRTNVEVSHAARSQKLAVTRKSEFQKPSLSLRAYAIQPLIVLEIPTVSSRHIL